MFRVLIVAAILAAGCGAQALLFTDATVLRPGRAGDADHQDVLVYDGRVRAIGPAGTVPVPDGAVRIDASNEFLMAGLCDAHVHVTDRAELLLYVAHGVTTVRNMWGGSDTLALKERIARGDVLGPAIFTTGPLIDGPDPRWPGSAVVTDDATARRLVDEHLEAGFDAIKVYDDLGPDAYFAIVHRARAIGLPVVGHVPRAVGLRGGIASGQRSIEHLRGWDRIADGSVDALARRCAEDGVWNCPTLVVLDLPWVALRDIGRARARPEVALVPPAIRSRWDPRTDARFEGVTEVDDELWESHRARMERARRIVLALHDAGAPLLVGTDAPNPFVVPGFSLHQELEAIHAVGVPTTEVLRMATQDAARFLGREDAGEVAVGHVADLLLLERDPREDIRATRSIAGVCVAGRWLPREEIDRRIGELLDGYETPKDWFEGMPALSEENLVTFDVTWNAQPIGAERILVERGPDGTVRSRGQWVYRDGFLERRAQFTASCDGGHASLSVEAWNGDRRGTIESESRDGVVSARGSTPFGQRVDLREAEAADVLLDASLAAHAVAFSAGLAGLAPGEATELVLRTPEFEESFELSRTVMRIEREGSGSRAFSGARVPVAIHRLRLRTGGFETRGTLTLSEEDGLPVTIELVFAQGHKVFHRRG